jgi:resuscitation-promoting factor RpfB
VRDRTRVKYRTVTEPAPAAPAAGPGSSSDGCSPEYEGTCVPDDVGDVNCSDLSATDFASVGSDPYGLDRDGDGIACES